MTIKPEHIFISIISAITAALPAMIHADTVSHTVQRAPAHTEEVNISSKSDAPEEPLSLWYELPAQNWVTEALPIGGGDFGAMIFGGIAQDRIQFNHKTLWSGSERTGDLGTYLNFGELYIINDNRTNASEYQRSLDINKAIASVSYVQDKSEFTREYIASFPDRVMAFRLSSPSDSPISIELQLINAQGNRASYTPGSASFSGTLPNGMSYAAAMKITTEGGASSASESGIKITGASEVTIYLACQTDFDATSTGHIKNDRDYPMTQAATIVDNAAKKGWQAILTDHVADYKKLFDRVSFNIDGAKAGLPMPELLKNQSDVGYGALLDMLIFQYGRYLTIASSRGTPLPSNLQGIWCKDGSPTSSAVWASDIHSNINIQMNYWPAEPTNLSECHLPFLDFIRNEALRNDGAWQRNARDLDATTGWVVNTAGNIFGGSSTYKVGKYSVANAWYCEHLWQHYMYTRDIEYLRSEAWPVMKAACQFWFERLQPAKNGDGTLECPNEYSPEQGYIQNATAHSQQLVTQLFINSLEAARILKLNQNSEFVKTLKEKLGRIDRGLRINENGQLREWKYQDNTPNIPADQNYFANDEENVWQAHRHTSHLMALYPGFEIDPGKDPDIFNAAIESLKDRGDVATGWARAWRISLWARARNAKRAYETLRGFSHRTTMLGYDWHGGLYDNLLDAHATSVFQIEGNFGATAGIAEMLLQSRPDSIVILPALPGEWPSGTIKGLKAIGNFEIDITWHDGHLTALNILSNAGEPITLAYPGLHLAKVRTASGKSVKSRTDSEGQLRFRTKKGMRYVIDIPELHSRK